MRSINSLILAGTAMVAALAFSPAMASQSQDRVSPSEVLDNAPDDAWRTLDPENTVYMDLPSGEMIIELRPDFAPGHVERIRTLTRRGFYDGTIFHRVIEGFMAQGGDPTGTGKGGSDLPNLQGEFMRAADGVEGLHIVGRDRRSSRLGFVGPIPVATQPEALKDFLVNDSIALWGMHCRGVLSMARANDPNSANSQFFLMFGDSRRSLDQRYTIFGRIVEGSSNLRRINVGEPPERPTPINRMRMAADLPESDRHEVKVLRTDTNVFDEYLKAIRAVDDTGYIDDVCSINIPVKIDGEIEL